MRTIRSAFPLALLFLLASAVSPAQNNCPEGFRYLGTLSGYGTSVERFDARRSLLYLRILRSTTHINRKRCAPPTGRTVFIRACVHKMCQRAFISFPYGENSSSVHGQGWAVSAPQLRALHRHARGKVTRYEFGMKLLCDARTTGANALSSARWLWTSATGHCASFLGGSGSKRIQMCPLETRKERHSVQCGQAEGIQRVRQVEVVWRTKRPTLHEADQARSAATIVSAIGDSDWARVPNSKSSSVYLT
jgi:hypothetical protein